VLAGDHAAADDSDVEIFHSGFVSFLNVRYRLTVDLLVTAFGYQGTVQFCMVREQILGHFCSSLFLRSREHLLYC
jgi:hypothetical protein